MQDGRVIVYILRKLRRHEENYVTHDLELLTIVYALRFQRPHIFLVIPLQTNLRENILTL
jgi:hypothetical protein